MSAISVSTQPDRGQASVTVAASYPQQRLWFIHRLEHGAGGAYHVGCAVRLQGKLDVVALERALNSVVERHEVLRTRFVSAQGTVLQVIEPSLSFDLNVIALHAMKSPQNHCDFDAEIRRHANEAIGAGFDLELGPLIRGRLLQAGNEDHVLILSLHHIVCDGWSLGILIGEVATLYAAYRDGRDNPLQPLLRQYRHYAQWQREWLAGAQQKQQEDFWRDQLHGASPLLDLPTDRPRPAIQSYRGASIQFSLTAQMSTALRKLSRGCNVTLNMVLYAAWAIVLSRLSGQEDLVIGAPIANRQSTDAERMIGLFANTLALRADLSGEPSIMELLKRVRSMMLAAWSHQELPFEHVVQLVQPVRSLEHSPVFQVLFVLQNTPLGAVHLDGLTLTPVTIPDTAAQFDVSLSMLEAGNAIIGNVNYATDLFDGATLQRWTSHLVHVLAAMLHDPQQCIGELQLQ